MHEGEAHTPRKAPEVCISAQREWRDLLQMEDAEHCSVCDNISDGAAFTPSKSSFLRTAHHKLPPRRGGGRLRPSACLKSFPGPRTAWTRATLRIGGAQRKRPCSEEE